VPGDLLSRGLRQAACSRACRFFSAIRPLTTGLRYFLAYSRIGNLTCRITLVRDGDHAVVSTG
jgi:hypothetical protein